MAICLAPFDWFSQWPINQTRHYKCVCVSSYCATCRLLFVLFGLLSRYYYYYFRFYYSCICTTGAIFHSFYFHPSFAPIGKDFILPMYVGWLGSSTQYNQQATTPNRNRCLIGYHLGIFINNDDDDDDDDLTNSTTNVGKYGITAHW